ncbi:MAG TPA: hypothetical protein VFN29_08130 [Chiayiivirga sp.]|nr:hypothetical protein [Chiayiivirga sp.]
MRHLMVLLMIMMPGLFACAMAQTESPPATIEFVVQGTLSIDAQGAVLQYALETKDLPEPVTDLIARTIAGWRFEPVLADGKAVPAKTRMLMQIQAQPIDGEKYQLSLADVVFGVRQHRGRTAPPKYPLDALRDRLGADLLIAARIDANGDVLEMHPWRTSLSRSYLSESAAEKWRKRFEAAAMDAIETWKFEPLSPDDGLTADSTFMIPMSFKTSFGDRASMEKRGTASFEFSGVPGPIHPIPWLPSSDQEVELTFFPARNLGGVPRVQPLKLIQTAVDKDS